MSDKIGPLTFGRKKEHVFLGRDLGSTRDHSENTATLIDESVKEIVTEAYKETLKILKENRDNLIKLAETLLVKEVLESQEINDILGMEG